MGYPFFSWRPHQQVSPVDGMGDREEILLDEDLTDLQITPKRDIVDAWSIGGGRSRQNMRAWMEVRITLDRFTDRTLFRKFRGMINHLERGGSIAFGNDHQKAVLGRINGYGVQGSDKIKLGVNECSGYSSAVGDKTELDVGDGLVIESPLPLANRHYSKIGQKVAFGFDSTILYKSLDPPLYTNFPLQGWGRHEDFFPTLVLPSVGGAYLTHDRRLTYTLDITLVYVLPRLNSGNAPQGDADGDKFDW